jgi:tRNA (adenine-N(1)-)-methyltransferase non-catalytic subunit
MSEPHHSKPKASEDLNESTAADVNVVGGSNDAIQMIEDGDLHDPLLELPSPVVREGDYVILVFGDGRQTFAQCLKSWKGKAPPVKINKRSYPTANLVGLPYGTVLELGLAGLSPLPDGEDIIPELPSFLSGTNSPGELDSSGAAIDKSQLEDAEATADDNTFPSAEGNDNRNLVDNNESQSLPMSTLLKMKRSGADGEEIVKSLIENSSTFDQKTEFSKAKYIARKQKKYQPRCRIVRCTASSICEALSIKEPRKMMNMREDTLGQILSYSNISAGCQCLIMETCMGVITGAVAQRMGGYGKVISIYSGQQPPFLEMISRFNLSFAETNSIKWLHSGDVFAEDDATSNDPEVQDPEKVERECLDWPCPLQDHTRAYLESMGTTRERTAFLAKRCARFARKLTRHTDIEAKEYLLARPCDSVIIVARYDPTASLLELLPHLSPSCPFVVFCEFIEPLTACFRELQRQGLAINIRLSDTWMREYQVLPGRTHPSMNMSQSGGFILTGIKLCPETGHNELDDDLLTELRGLIGGRRGNKKSKHDEKSSKNGRKKGKGNSNQATKRGRTKNENDSLSSPNPDSKRTRGDEDSH